jgi:FixJ family two-component response regulator
VIRFESATAYLGFTKPEVPGCLIRDLQLPGMNGLELQQDLVLMGGSPIIFLTAHGDISSSVKAMKAGAAEFLLKPFNSGELISAIESAIKRTARFDQRTLNCVRFRKNISRSRRANGRCRP